MNSLFCRLSCCVCMWAMTAFESTTHAQIDPFASALSKKNATPVATNDTPVAIDTSRTPAPVAVEAKNVMVSDPEFESLLKSEIEFKIPIITCTQLYDLLQKKMHPKQLVILDARSITEFNVSHLEHAKRIGYEDFSNENVWSYNRQATIIIYAALGEQSEAIGLKMREMGFKNVYNLYGSILEWVNQGYTVVDSEGKKTREVHVFDKNRAKYLKRGKAVF